MNRIIHQDIAVTYQFPVVFTRGLFDPTNRVLAETLRSAIESHPKPRLLVFIDDAVLRAFPSLADQATRYVAQHIPRLHLCTAPYVVPGGESLKSNRGEIDRLVRLMADAQLDRHSFVLAIGGGAVLDAVGFAASLIHRGVRLIRVPTTVLAQNDGGVGVKTAINDPAGKNFLGTFAPPFAVMNDADFLAALPDEHWRSGIAEAFKVAMIKDSAFFDWLCAHAAALAARDMAVMDELVFRCAELHLTHIRTSGDPFEMGRARPLDFGHWSAHEWETMSGYTLGHGQAVAMGIMVDSLYAVRHHWLDTGAADRLFRGLVQSGFTLWHEVLDRRDAEGRLRVLAGLDRFREHLGGQLCVTMPNGLGRSMEISEMDSVAIAASLQELHERVLAVPH